MTSCSGPLSRRGAGSPRSAAACRRMPNPKAWWVRASGSVEVPAEPGGDRARAGRPAASRDAASDQHSVGLSTVAARPGRPRPRRRVVVLPVPGAPSTRSTPPRCATAACWTSSRTGARRRPGSGARRRVSTRQDSIIRARHRHGPTAPSPRAAGTGRSQRARRMSDPPGRPNAPAARSGRALARASARAPRPPGPRAGSPPARSTRHHGTSRRRTRDITRPTRRGPPRPSISATSPYVMTRPRGSRRRPRGRPRRHSAVRVPASVHASSVVGQARVDVAHPGQHAAVEAARRRGAPRRQQSHGLGRADAGLAVHDDRRGRTAACAQRRARAELVEVDRHGAGDRDDRALARARARRPASNGRPRPRSRAASSAASSTAASLGRRHGRARGGVRASAPARRTPRSPPAR